MLQKKILVALCLTLLPLLNFSHGLAQTTVAHDACDAATVTAARSVGVPERFLLAIARAESGRTIKQRFAPWPWAVNVEGRGIFFQTRAGASALSVINLRQVPPASMWVVFKSISNGTAINSTL